MIENARKEEQQRKASERYYSRQKATEMEGPSERFRREIIMAEAQPIERRLSFLKPGDGLALERIMGKSDLVDISYLELGLLAARPVCRIQIVNPFGRPEGYGTGFLVGPNLLLTNNHVIDTAELARKSFAEFGFEQDINGRRKISKSFDLRPDEVFITDPDLDFTLVSMASLSTEGTELTDYGLLRLIEDTGKIRIGEYVSIIQHPEGGLKQCCLRENELVDIFDNWLHYMTDSECGSSGSPVFNDQWLVVGLHHSGVPKKDAQGNILKTDGQAYREGIDNPSTIAWVANEGVRISCIFQALESRSDNEPMVAEALRRLRSNGTGPVGPAIITAPEPISGTTMELGELPAKHYHLADGYNPDFLGSQYHLPLPKLADNLQSKVAKLKDGSEILTYLHFSIVMNADRRLAFYTAVNIDGKKLENIKRGRDKWYFDPRLDQKYQAGPKLYENNRLDRGHLVRRLDPCWGPNAKDAGEDTFHFTNCSPQHERFNQHDWLEVEDYILKTADNANVQISGFIGPVFREDDMIYRNEYLLPADFWKVVVFVNKNGKLSATAYLRTQKNYLESMEFFDDEFKTWQVPVAQVEALTGLSFGLPTDADPMARASAGKGLESQRSNIRRIRSAADIML
ncbi:DNA/RNA non-specific endonuclease [Methanosarcina sp. UBA5]|uniref:DNA/RNA non-specific endonuclease n=1 Tax=Methanosarcina sp. UBA5 TaxID=1915593 RepID=UPI0025D23B21|nr:DNA/RNA non-specific endonuclease [Methanosarcina sp. UBA5]